MKLFFEIIFLTFGFVLMGCSPSESDPCKVDHVIINGECVPDYIFPNQTILKNGDKYYHQEYGLIMYKNKHWFDVNDEIIEDLEIKAEQ